ncbi:hypothetical protein OAD50_05405 [Vicingaceae bacterium]|nr:hypothetical protein [Vicingaceae bacterium]
MLDVRETHDNFTISSSNESYKVQLAVGAHGKRSILDKKLNRAFMTAAQRESNNYVGIKYHIKAHLPENLIGLHLFKNGYCGISKVDGTDRFCLCYLTLASNLKNSGCIENMEKEILSKNNYLKEYLKYEWFYDQPLVISQIRFERKKPIEDGVFMLGDAAGLIVPLCGNGMSMALKAAHEFHNLSKQF